MVDDFADSSINILGYCIARTNVYSYFLDSKLDVLLKIIRNLHKKGLNFKDRRGCFLSHRYKL
ncbi:hypothetical protein [Campylobacter concisus]|uniref:hypothetical protein n=1 Tax=Campylobacter concisus TaxID=199 RepID=UPI00215639FF|nr:hypothetical protein [Campylobacter concisus]